MNKEEAKQRKKADKVADKVIKKGLSAEGIERGRRMNESAGCVASDPQLTKPQIRAIVDDFCDNAEQASRESLARRSAEAAERNASIRVWQLIVAAIAVIAIFTRALFS